jgi:lantibiotic modifying enzyme
LLLDGSRVLGHEADAAVVEEAADRALALAEDGDGGWPCGIGTGETPGLMLGLAGIGYFFLRVANPLDVPSMLAPSRRVHEDA